MVNQLPSSLTAWQSGQLAAAKRLFPARRKSRLETVAARPRPVRLPLPVATSFSISNCECGTAMSDDRTKVMDVSASFGYAERRNYPRYALTAAVHAVDTAQCFALNARISDLGRGGCYIDALSPFPMKTGVKLRITSEKRSFEAQANVVYSRSGMGMGLAFTTVEPEQLIVLDQWLSELSGASPAQAVSIEGKGHGAAKDLSSDEQWYALIERTIALVRQGNLTNEQGKSVLRNLLNKNI
jgi:hypothetical protein